MCLTIPGRIEAILNEFTARADLDGEKRDVSIALCGPVEIGDWVLVHLDQVMHVVDEETAQEILTLLKEVDGMSVGADGVAIPATLSFVGSKTGGEEALDQGRDRTKAAVGARRP